MKRWSIASTVVAVSASPGPAAARDGRRRPRRGAGTVPDSAHQPSRSSVSAAGGPSPSGSASDEPTAAPATSPGEVAGTHGPAGAHWCRGRRGSAQTSRPWGSWSRRTAPRHLLQVDHLLDGGGLPAAQPGVTTGASASRPRTATAATGRPLGDVTRRPGRVRRPLARRLVFVEPGDQVGAEPGLRPAVGQAHEPEATGARLRTGLAAAPWVRRRRGRGGPTRWRAPAGAGRPARPTARARAISSATSGSRDGPTAPDQLVDDRSGYRLAMS